MTTLDVRQSTHKGHPTYRSQVAAILEADLERAGDPAGIAAEVGCSLKTARRYCEEYRTCLRRQWRRSENAGESRRCRLCECQETVDEPLGRSGLCVDCWWSFKMGLNYYAYRTDSITEEQWEALVAEFGKGLD